MRSSGGGGNVNGGDSAVAHVADGVVDGGKGRREYLFGAAHHLASVAAVSAGGSSQGRQEYQQ